MGWPNQKGRNMLSVTGAWLFRIGGSILHNHGRGVVVTLNSMDLGNSKCNTRILSGLLLPIGQRLKSCQYQ